MTTEKISNDKKIQLVLQRWIKKILLKKKQQTMLLLKTARERARSTKFMAIMLR